MSKRVGKCERTVVESVAAADWLDDSDAAAVELARSLAAAVDGMAGEPASKRAYVSQQLLAILRELGLSPQSRGRLDRTVDGGDALADIRSINFGT